MKINVPFVSFEPMHNMIRKELDDAYREVIDNNMFIQGENCTRFEQEFAEYCNCKYCVGVATGLDSLYLILKAYDLSLIHI